jgi:hypothetical protein
MVCVVLSAPGQLTSGPIGVGAELGDVEVTEKDGTVEDPT